jgi:hypothetical protein
MATSLDLIKRAMRQLGVYSIGEEPSADEAQDGLEALNAMLDSWATENLFVYAKTLDVVPVIASQQSFTIGPTGTVVSVRPVSIDASSYVLYQNVSYPLAKWTDADYQLISLKGQILGIPCGFWPLMNYPDAQVTLWPIPSAAMDVYLWSNKLIKSFPDLVTDLDLPPGYERAIVFSLAEEIAPEYEVEPSRTVVMKASQGRRNLKRINTQVPLMQMPYGIPNANNYTNGRLL